jgi:hypothetical protein
MGRSVPPLWYCDWRSPLPGTNVRAPVVQLATGALFVSWVAVG